MTDFGVADVTGSGSGWNLTVQGQSGTGKSPVFAQYCPQGQMRPDNEGYIPSGHTRDSSPAKGSGPPAACLEQSRPGGADHDQSASR